MSRTNGRRWATALACCAILGVAMTIDVPPVAAGITNAVADRPSPKDLSHSALEGILRESNPRALDAAVRQAHQTMAEQAATAPDALGSASVVFADGLTPARVANLGLDLLTAEAKVPVGTSGEVYTMWLNDFQQREGTLQERLDRAIGKMRLRYFQQASAAPKEEQATLRELAGSDIRFYRLEVVATHARLAGLLKDPSVTAVLPATDNKKVVALQDLRARLASVKRAAPAAPAVRLVSGDPAKGSPPGTPVLTNSGQRCAWQQSRGTLACQPATWQPISGDPVLDNALPRRDGGARTGTKSAAAPDAGPIRTLDDSSAWIGCNNPPVVPTNCPNDNTYRPHTDTGGGQAFAISIYNFPQGYNVFYDCYVYWVDDPYAGDGADGYWQTQCYQYVIYTDAFTYGYAAWASKWGTQVTYVGASGTSRPISTLAFKAPELPHCRVSQSLGTAECNKADPNVTFVPSPGIEDELLMSNPACQTGITGRDGNASDWDDGCFYPTYAESNLPAAYLDTTFGDGATYDLAVGTSNPATIVEGVTYRHYAEFQSLANRTNNMVGTTAFHSVSVDSWVDDSAACYYGKYVRNPAEPSAFCLFPVDASRVSNPVPFT
jgi:hypothetical protein